MITLIGSDNQRVTLDRIEICGENMDAVTDGDTVIRATWETGEVETLIVKLNVPLQQVLMNGWDGDS